TGRYQRERPGLAALALTTDGAFLTAYSNDYDFEGVFERQVEALGRPGDVLLGISTSGESGNVLRAVLKAREMGLLTVGLCGSGGLLRGMADFVLAVPSRDTALIQECHLALEHSLALVVEELLHGATGRPVQATTLTEVG
ncbi:MAG: SIS domain-containing protein, partial [Acidobacteriota bacterium]